MSHMTRDVFTGRADDVSIRIAVVANEIGKMGREKSPWLFADAIPTVATMAAMPVLSMYAGAKVGRGLGALRK